MTEEDPPSIPTIPTVERPRVIITPEVFAERLERLEREMERRKKEFQEFRAVIEEREKLKREIDKIKDARWKERIAWIAILCSLGATLIMLFLRLFGPSFGSALTFSMYLKNGLLFLSSVALT
jgi:hypothetical protein